MMAAMGLWLGTEEAREGVTDDDDDGMDTA